MKRNLIFLNCLLIISGLFALSVFGQNLRATAFQIKKPGEYSGGDLSITVGGKKKKIYDAAFDAWIINGGKEVVFSGADGAGGFENEGQSLRIYDVKMGKTRKIMSEYGFVLGLTEAKLSNGANALLVWIGDGGLGASYFAVVDPKRGEVFHRKFAELTEINGDKIKLAIFNGDDWEAINQERDWDEKKSKSAIPPATKVKPEKTESYDLKELLKNKVIYNKTNEEREAEYERKYKDVVIYLWRPNESLPNKEFFIMAVGRAIKKENAFAPLRPTLELLFAEADKNDIQNGFASTTFGLKFVGVVLKNGTATIKFSQPQSNQKFTGLEAEVFLEAVEKTAKQFPTVKNVEICAVGKTSFDSEVARKIPNCGN